MDKNYIEFKSLRNDMHGQPEVAISMKIGIDNDLTAFREACLDFARALGYQEKSITNVFGNED